MKPLEFLAAVLPSPGHGKYCVVELSSRRKEHVFIDDLQEVRPAIRRWLEAQRDIYFALCTFDPNAPRRKAENARYVRALFIDMDGYESKKAAGLALTDFLQRTGLDAFGSPYVVSSGGGLHCYWPLAEAVPVDQWKPVAENFKRLCKQEGLSIDHTVTADAARVLRIPETFNFKEKYETPRPVKLLVEGDAVVDLWRFSAIVRDQLSDAFAPPSNQHVISGVALEGQRPSKLNGQRSAVAEAMMQNSRTTFEPIWLKTANGNGCAQLAYYKDNAQQDGMEPLWRALLSWAKVCDDGDDFAKVLSSLHPYPEQRMQQKLAEIKGPYSCAKLDSENPGVCPTCPHWGRITNALALGREVRTDNSPKLFEIPLQTDEEGLDEGAQYALDDGLTTEADEEGIPENKRTRLMQRPVPPKGFDYGQNGGVYVNIEEKDATGVKVQIQREILPYDLFVVDMLRMTENEHYAHLMAVKKIGPADKPEEQRYEYTRILLPSRSIVAKDELLKGLAMHNVYASHGASTDAFLYHYVRACVEQSSTLKSAVDVPVQLGWQKDRTFVYNNRIFFPDGNEIAVPMPGLENINRNTNSKGTLEGWRKAWNLMIEREMYTMLALCLDSFGSTLMHFSEYDGFTWHIGSTESGTGKTLSLALKAGVWGHPIKFRTSKGTSFVALQQRAGLLNSLPLLVDEATNKLRSDPEYAPVFIFDQAEGQGKERMESGANKERINNSTWSNTATLTSNTHMVDILTGARKHAAQGELMRMLEWTPNVELRFTDTERETLKELRRNYGVAGEAWVRWIVRNYSLIQRVWNEVHANLRKEFSFTDEERYWHAACTCDVTAAILLGPQYANLLNVPVKKVVLALKDMVSAARGTCRTSARSALDVLNAYTREFYGKFVIIRRGEGTKFLTEFIGTEGRTSTRNTVMGRIEHGVNNPEYIDYYIEEQLLRQHCASMSFGYTDFKRKLTLETKGSAVMIESTKKNMLARTDGPEMRVSALHIALPKELVETEVVSIPLGDA